jgi:hypothetical protein
MLHEYKTRKIAAKQTNLSINIMVKRCGCAIFSGGSHLG